MSDDIDLSFQGLQPSQGLSPSTPTVGPRAASPLRPSADVSSPINWGAFALGAQPTESASQESYAWMNPRLSERGSAQNSLFGVDPNMGRHLSVQVNPRRAGMSRNTQWQQDSWGRTPQMQQTFTYGQAANQFWQMEGQQLGRVQEVLVRSGFLNPDHVGVYGKHDPAGRDHNAWLNALEMAARLNREVFGMLDEAAETGAWDPDGAGGAGGPARRRPDVQLLSAQDAKKMAEAIGQELIGRKLTDAELSKVVSTIHGQQRSEQGRAIDVSMTDKGGGEYQNPTSPDTIAENTIKEQHATEVQGTEALGAFNQLMQLMGGGGR